MSAKLCLRWVALFVLCVGSLSGDVLVYGQVVSSQGSGVEAFFASQSELFTDSDPPGAIWGTAGPGPYAPGAGLPFLPAVPTPSLTPAPGNSFSGTSYSTTFNDNLGTNSYTAAQYVIDDFVSLTPTVTSDIQVVFPAWRLEQAPSAPGYAYNQLNFGSNYLITLNPGLLASPNPGLPLLLSGQTIGLGSWAQFDAVIDYTWTPITINSDGTISQSSPSAPLGSLSYSFLVNNPGNINTTLFSSGSLLATPAGDGVLSLTGHAWIAGDPFTLNVSSIPEPATAMLAACGALLMTVSVRRRA
jgi:hypothetical protein